MFTPPQARAGTAPRRGQGCLISIHLSSFCTGELAQNCTPARHTRGPPDAGRCGHSGRPRPDIHTGAKTPHGGAQQGERGAAADFHRATHTGAHTRAQKPRMAGRSRESVGARRISIGLPARGRTRGRKKTPHGGVGRHGKGAVRRLNSPGCSGWSSPDRGGRPGSRPWLR